MTFQDLIDNINPTVYEALKRAIEIGKWPDGRALTSEQREHCMSAVIAYDLQSQQEEQRVGYIDRGPKTEGEVCGDDHSHDQNAEQTLKWAK
ncbi:Protein of unknown function (DUF1315) [Spongiibacter sp. IMCC21906]|uniref:YeaC family protein n=1 Tax=Spongiibacter sp. IMCC21906 TaxID=1620392 RepID=UPI00062DEED9|nr:DUF1315 family protein [Spongiibacter sp. IMCC21906]AKH69467.1 Protein of unknown function (DUF1315) [Spongiibacter sp. IMCC21906]